MVVADDDEIEKEAIGKDNFGSHVSGLHADGDLGFSQEYEVRILINVRFMNVLEEIILVNLLKPFKFYFFMFYTCLQIDRLVLNFCTTFISGNKQEHKTWFDSY